MSEYRKNFFIIKHVGRFIMWADSLCYTNAAGGAGQRVRGDLRGLLRNEAIFGGGGRGCHWFQRFVALELVYDGQPSPRLRPASLWTSLRCGGWPRFVCRWA